MKPSIFQRSAPLFLLTLSTTSCAAMYTGTKSQVHFTSEPKGLEVRAGDSVGVTPVTLSIKKSVKNATFTNPDGSQRDVVLERKFQGGFLLMDILFTPGYGLIGLIVDGATSAWYTHEHVVHCDMTKPEPIRTAPAAAPAVARRTDPD